MFFQKNTKQLSKISTLPLIFNSVEIILNTSLEITDLVHWFQAVRVTPPMLFRTK